MPEKLIIMIFIYACAASVLASSAHLPRPIHGGSEEREEREKEAKGTQDGVDENEEWEKEREEDRVRGIPESVLSVRYDRGFIKELHLSQGAGGIRNTREWSPSLSDKSRICDDLCRAGLGGDPCGYSCLDRTPGAIKNITGNSNTQPTTKKPKEDEDQTIGNPRSDVCPTLCKNGLGKPLCGCSGSRTSDAHWQSVCDSFCQSTVGSYCVNGCPPCDGQTMIADGESKQNSGDSDKWVEYCKQQCRTGNGGAACNCDKIPFVLRP